MANTHGGAAPDYFVPAPSQWPVVGMIAMAFTGFGAAMVVNHSSAGWVPLAIYAAAMVQLGVVHHLVDACDLGARYAFGFQARK